MNSEDPLNGRSKAPDNSRGCPVVGLVGAGIVSTHVVALHPPGEVLEEELVIRAAADVQRGRIVEDAAGVDALNAAHAMHERAPLAESGGQAKTTKEVVL